MGKGELSFYRNLQVSERRMTCDLSIIKQTNKMFWIKDIANHVTMMARNQILKYSNDYTKRLFSSSLNKSRTVLI